MMDGDFSAQAHDTALFDCRMATVLAGFARRAPELASLIEEWIRRLPDQAGVSLRSIVLGSRPAAAVVMRGGPPDSRVRIRPDLRGVAGAGDEATLRGLIEQGRVLLRAGRGEAATSALLAASRLDGRLAAESVLELDHAGRRALMIDANGSRGTLLLRYWPRRRFAPRLFALLVPEGSESDASLCPFLAVAGESYRVAEFARLPDGSYDLLVGPSIDGGSSH